MDNGQSVSSQVEDEVLTALSEDEGHLRVLGLGPEILEGVDRVHDLSIPPEMSASFRKPDGAGHRPRRKW